MDDFSIRPQVMMGRDQSHLNSADPPPPPPSLGFNTIAVTDGHTLELETAYHLLGPTTTYRKGSVPGRDVSKLSDNLRSLVRKRAFSSGAGTRVIA